MDKEVGTLDAAATCNINSKNGSSSDALMDQKTLDTFCAIPIIYWRSRLPSEQNLVVHDVDGVEPTDFAFCCNRSYLCWNAIKSLVW